MGDHMSWRYGCHLDDSYPSDKNWCEVLVGFTVIPVMPFWQLLVVSAVLLWLFIARSTSLALNVRRKLRPAVTQLVHKGVITILRVQKLEGPIMTTLMVASAWLVTIEFYTASLPLFYWSGNSKLGRLLTTLMALCMYVGNVIKDCVSAPRPPSPPVRRLDCTEVGKETAAEYGLPSSHTLSTLCLFGYLVYYLRNTVEGNPVWLTALSIGLALLLLIVIFGRIYLGMHALVDIVAGAVLGVALLFLWCRVDEHVDLWITQGENAMSFQVCLALLALLAYPVPEIPTPGFAQHTAFNGVVLGMVWAFHRTHGVLYVGERSLDLLSWVGVISLAKRCIVGFPLILVSKSVSKALGKLVVPNVCRAMGFQVHSSEYLPNLAAKEVENNYPKKVEATLKTQLRSGGSRTPVKLLFGEQPVDVDTGIRLLQYAGLAWSTMELVPWVFHVAGI